MLKCYLSRHRLEIFVLIVFTSILSSSVCNAAPTQENRILKHTDGCYYNYNHYGEGDRIQTNEPCLNCTCHNQMLMCYLRVCPFTKPIDHDCTIEKREDQCCPIITCPEVPVQLMDQQLTNTEIGLPERSGCIIDDKFYPEGRQVPSNPNKPCELCYCIRNKTSCIMQECTLHIDGCQPIYNRGSCCPVRYNCDNEIENELLLEEHVTTVRPTPGFMITTPLSYGVGMKDCTHHGITYAEGSIVESDKPCEHCYCMKGDIVCAVQECTNPVGVTPQNCISSTASATFDENECCPKMITCDSGEEIQNRTSTVTEAIETEKILTSTIMMPTYTSTSQQEDSQTHQPPHSDEKKIVEGISSEDLQLQEHISEGYVDNVNALSPASAPSTVPTFITDSQDTQKTTEEKLRPIVTAATTEGAEYSVSMKTTESTEGTLPPSLPSSSSLSPQTSTKEEYEAKDTTTVYTIKSTSVEQIITTAESSTSGAIEEITPNRFSESNLQSTEFSSPVINEIPDSIPGEGFCLIKGISYKNYDTVTNDCNLPCICLNSLVVCKSNCDKSPNCQNFENNPGLCCSSITCDYDIIEPLEKEESILWSQTSTQSYSGLNEINGSDSNVAGTTIDLFTTEKADFLERKEILTTTEASKIFDMTSSNEIIDATSEIYDNMRRTQFEQSTTNLGSFDYAEGIKQKNFTKEIEDEFEISTTERQKQQSTSENEFVTSSEPSASVPDLVTEYNPINGSYLPEQFLIRDSITEKPESEKSSVIVEDHYITSPSSTTVFDDIEQTKTTASEQKEFSVTEKDQQTPSESTSFDRHDETSEKVESPDFSSSPESQRFDDTVYSELSTTTEFAVSDLIKLTQTEVEKSNETAFKKIDSSDKENVEVTQSSTLVSDEYQYLTDRPSVTKIKTEQEEPHTIDIDSSSSIPEKEYILTSSPTNEISQTTIIPDDSKYSTQKAYEIVTEKSISSPSTSPTLIEMTSIYDDRNETSIEIQTQKPESLTHDLFDEETSSSLSSTEADKITTTKSVLLVSTEGPSIEKVSYDTKTENIEDLTTTVTFRIPELKTPDIKIPEGVSDIYEKEQIEEEYQPMTTVSTEEQAVDVHDDNVRTEKQEEMGIHFDIKTEEELSTDEPQEFDAHSHTEITSEKEAEIIEEEVKTEKSEELEHHLTTTVSEEKPFSVHYGTTTQRLEPDVQFFSTTEISEDLLPMHTKDEKIPQEDIRIGQEPDDSQLGVKTEKQETAIDISTTEPSKVEIAQSSTEKFEDDVEHDEKLTVRYDTSTTSSLSEFETTTVAKIIDNEIIEQGTTPVSFVFSSPTSSVSFVSHEIQQNATETNVIPDVKTTESFITHPHVQDEHPEYLTQRPLTSSPTTEYTSTKVPSYQQNLGQFPPHYPAYSEDDYNEEEETESFGPGTCRYGGKLFVSAQQIPRDDPCDFCFCFRSDIICLQQSCPPPISGCHEEPIQGFCCPRYECPVSMAAQLNTTTSTTTTTTTPPHHLSHNLLSDEIVKTGCYIGGKSYRIGDRVESTSGPCMNCRCGGDGQMKCEPKPCTPEPMLRQMIAVVASRRR